MVALKNCEPELSYILAEFFSKCLKESCFLDYCKASLVVPVFKNVGERSTVKNYHLVSLLSVVGKVFEKLVHNRIVDDLEKCGHFSDLQHGFRSSGSIADLLKVVPDRIARAFHKPFLIVDLEWFWMGSLHKNSQLMLEFLKALFLVLQFS